MCSSSSDYDAEQAVHLTEQRQRFSSRLRRAAAIALCLVLNLYLLRPTASSTRFADLEEDWNVLEQGRDRLEQLTLGLEAVALPSDEWDKRIVQTANDRSRVCTTYASSYLLSSSLHISRGSN